MEVRWITAKGFEHRSAAELPQLLARDDGFVWVDIDRLDEEAAEVLSGVFRFHALGVRECHKRVPLPKLHAYQDHFFLVLYSVQLEKGSRLRLFQLGFFIHEQRYLVTVQDPQIVSSADILERETHAVLARMEAGRFLPRTPSELGHAIISTLAHRMEDCVGRIATQVEKLERSITRGRLHEYERMLAGMFEVRHDLQTLRTMASTSREVHARMVAYSRGLQSESVLWLQDSVDHFDRLKNICDGEKELMQEILDLYQTRVANDLSQLVRRLTALGAILVADTLVAGIYGMNFDVMPELHWRYGYAYALALMAAVSAAMFWWFRRKDWL
ncbi:MAG TPA: magnesium transporter CorA family protein [Candidatus Binatia bacterium]|nr:magnesium transporter CorA family protein [Candidatus Binatia bacterium]